MRLPVSATAATARCRCCIHVHESAAANRPANRPANRTAPGETGRPVEAAIKAEPRLPAPILPPEGSGGDVLAEALAGRSFAPATKRIASAEALQRFLGSQVTQVSIHPLVINAELWWCCSELGRCSGELASLLLLVKRWFAPAGHVGCCSWSCVSARLACSTAPALVTAMLICKAP